MPGFELAYPVLSLDPNKVDVALTLLLPRVGKVCEYAYSPVSAQREL